MTVRRIRPSRGLVAVLVVEGSGRGIVRPRRSGSRTDLSLVAVRRWQGQGPAGDQLEVVEVLYHGCIGHAVTHHQGDQIAGGGMHRLRHRQRRGVHQLDRLRRHLLHHALHHGRRTRLQRSGWGRRRTGRSRIDAGGMDPAVGPPQAGDGHHGARLQRHRCGLQQIHGEVHARAIHPQATGDGIHRLYGAHQGMRYRERAGLQPFGTGDRLDGHHLAHCQTFGRGGATVDAHRGGRAIVHLQAVDADAAEAGHHPMHQQGTAGAAQALTVAGAADPIVASVGQTSAGAAQALAGMTGAAQPVTFLLTAAQAGAAEAVAFVAQAGPAQAAGHLRDARQIAGASRPSHRRQHPAQEQQTQSGEASTPRGGTIPGRWDPRLPLHGHGPVRRSSRALPPGNGRPRPRHRPPRWPGG